ncbi:hypothetical protein IKL64_06655 [bacterium]|nr:hypothetical protein [bacterium]
MKKILILSALFLSCVSLPVFSACKIENLGACKADIGNVINSSLQDKIMPNNLERIKQPHNSFENRTQLGQPQIPENINMEPIQEENTQPYNANCQFGNCFNRQNAGENSNNR